MKDLKSGPAEGKIFMNGRSQAVRLPKAFRLPGSRVKVSKVGNGILLTPIADDVEAWFKEMDRLGGETFFAEGRDQPAMPPDKDLFG